jgi:hypothetical protein
LGFLPDSRSGPTYIVEGEPAKGAQLPNISRFPVQEHRRAVGTPNSPDGQFRCNQLHSPADGGPDSWGALRRWQSRREPKAAACPYCRGGYIAALG